ncbi:MAG: hypothetical protein HKL90_03730 [Elusimicrobia bacterium]|nr:hypothetical protein [Elusimicrobiota bacterium]
MISPRTFFALTFALAAAPAFAAPASRAARFQAQIGKVFTQETVANMARNKDEGYRFESFDARTGYARVVGPFDGRNDFFLLSGPKGDVLIMVEYSCGPACTQKASAFLFAADAPAVHLAFKDVLSLPAFDELRRRLTTLCLDAGGDFDTERDARDAAARDLPACPYVLSLSKRGDGATLYKASNVDGSGYALSVAKSRVTPKAALRWNGRAFAGVGAVDDSPILLQSDQMRALF